MRRFLSASRSRASCSSVPAARSLYGFCLCAELGHSAANGAEVVDHGLVDQDVAVGQARYRAQSWEGIERERGFHLRRRAGAVMAHKAVTVEAKNHAYPVDTPTHYL